jgi:hypothetical protein
VFFGLPFFDSFLGLDLPEVHKILNLSDLVRDVDFNHFFMGLGKQKASKFNGLKKAVNLHET